jgi:hypothetical protein
VEGGGKKPTNTCATREFVRVCNANVNQLRHLPPNPPAEPFESSATFCLHSFLPKRPHRPLAGSLSLSSSSIDTHGITIFIEREDKCVKGPIFDASTPQR